MIKQTDVIIKERKVRSDRGKARNGYKARLVTLNSVPTERRKYSMLNRQPKLPIQTEAKETIKTKLAKTEMPITARLGKLKVVLSKYERAVLATITENQHVMNAMVDGSLPFLIGVLIQKYSLTFLNEAGAIRTKLIRSTLNHLQELKLLRIKSASSRFPFGAGQLELI